MPGIRRIIDKLYKSGFSSVKAIPGRATALDIDGARVEIKMANPTSQGKWKVNIHRHGEVDESGVDAYLICLMKVPGFDGLTMYLILPAPVNRSGFEFSTASLIRTYSESIENWEMLQGIAKKASKKVAIAAKIAPAAVAK